MSYEVLARKLRPSGFDALVGQDHVVRALRHALDDGRLHHAYLFTGTRGVGKTTIARILAKSLNCEEGVSSDPCGQCSVCMEVKENRFLDLIEVDAASRTGVDDTRELLENAQYMPSRGRYKIYLIDEVHMLSTASFNALLKTLEEPPEHVKFLLATTEPKKVPATVLSRCLQFQLKNLSRHVIEEYLSGVLADEGIAFEDAALQTISRSAAGSMRDALSVTDQAIAYGQGSLVASDVADMLGIVGEQDVEKVIEFLRSGDVHALLDHCAELADQNADFSELLHRLIEALHRMAVSAATGTKDPAFSDEEIQLYYQIALMGSRDIALAPELRSGFEMTLLRMLAFAPESSSIPPRTGDKENTGEGQLGNDPDQQVSQQAKPDEAVDHLSQDNSIVVEDGIAQEAKEDAGILGGVTNQSAVTERSGHGDMARWYELVNELTVAGVTRMICENTVLERYELPEIDLCLDAEHDTLLSDAQTLQIERALAECVGQEVKLTIRLGEPATETPATRTKRVAQERQSAAEAAIGKDSTVAGIINTFGGKVEEIRPL